MNNTRKFWQFPWSFGESLLISLALFVTGWMIQAVTGKQISSPSFPVNLYMLLGYMLLLILLQGFGSNLKMVQWVSSVPAAVASITLFGGLSLVMGLVAQSPLAAPDDIFHNITASWIYLFSLLFLLTVLGMTVIRRSRPFNGRNLWFLLNHLGLWVVLAGAAFGAGDIKRYMMETRLNEPVWLASDEQGRRVEPGIAIELQRFTVDYFAPEISLYDTRAGKPVKKFKPVLADSAGILFSSGGWQVTIAEVHPSAVAVNEVFRPFNGPGGVPAVFLKAVKDGAALEGWINPGNEINPARYLMLDDTQGLVLSFPKPEYYRSDIKVYSKTGNVYRDSVAVNEPAFIEGWRIYQVSYDDSMGAWSQTSTVELNRDPWLPVVYAGLFMMIAGALSLFFRGIRWKGQQS